MGVGIRHGIDRSSAYTTSLGNAVKIMLKKGRPFVIFAQSSRNLRYHKSSKGKHSTGKQSMSKVKKWQNRILEVLKRIKNKIEWWLTYGR